MYTIIVTRRPDGQSPEWVRDAWVGVTLPTLHHAPHTWRRVAGQTSSLGYFARLAALLRGQTVKVRGYLVDGPTAIERLSGASPEAAQWYRENTPDVVSGKMTMVFDATFCERGPDLDQPADYVAATEALLRVTSAKPMTIALCWIAATMVRIASASIDPETEFLQVTTLLYHSGTPVLAGLLAAGALGVRSNIAALLQGLVVFDLMVATLFGVAEVVTPKSDNFWTCLMANCVFSVVWASIHVGRFAPVWRRVLAAVLVVAAPASAVGLEYADGWLMSATYRARVAAGIEDPEADAEERFEPVAADLLWGQQESLLQEQVEGLRQPVGRGAQPWGNVFGIVVAASGQQDIFAREAHGVAGAISDHFHGTSRGSILLSNGKADLFKTPLATQDNFLASANGIAKQGDPQRDVAFVYLASHGGKDASLQTALPDYQTIRPISAATVATALGDAGLVRRVIVVSACYSGTWAKALANDDTILITASAKDRTSFGCDDERAMTVFGEAFVSALRTPGLSLQTVVAKTRERVTAEEKRLGATPSLPQVFVGRNMQDVWTATP